MPRRKKTTNQKNEEPQQWQFQENPTAKIWLWVGVGIFTAIILALWGWAASVRISSFSWGKTPEGKLIKQSQSDWDALFNNEESRIKNKQLKLQIKNMLNKIVAEANNAADNTSTISTDTAISSTLTTGSQDTQYTQQNSN